MNESSSQAAGPLVQTLEGLLPEAWRHDLAVNRHSAGVSVQFGDDGGRRHRLEVQPVRPDTPALITGEKFAYSYTLEGSSLDVPPELEEYRTVLARIAAHEAELSPLFEAVPGTADATLGDQKGAGALEYFPEGQVLPDDLMAIFREALPAEWQQGLQGQLLPGNVFFSCLDAAGHRHVFDVRKVSIGYPSLVTGQTLGYSYTMVDPAVAEESIIERYRAILAILASHETELVAGLERPPLAGERSDDPAEMPGGPHMLVVDYPDQTPATGTMAERVLALLPAEWRAGAQVSSILQGFTVGFRDAAGVRHLLEGRLVEAGFPSLVRGRRFGFSYRKIDQALDEHAMVPRYREALRAFVEHEDHLLADPE